MTTQASTTAPTPQPQPVARLEICPHCDTLVQLPPLQPGDIATCGRCGHELERFQGWSASALLALCATAWIAMLHVLLFPLVTLEVSGQPQASSIWQSIVFAWNSGHWTVGWMSFIGAVLLPLAELAVLTSALWLIALRQPSPLLPAVLRAVAITRHWNMLAVFLLGVLVALVKLATVGRLTIGVGLVSTAVLVGLMVLLARVTPRTLWRMAEQADLLNIRTPALPALLSTPAEQAGPHTVQPTVLVCRVCGMLHGHTAPANTPAAPAALIASLPHARLYCTRCHSRLHMRHQTQLSHCWAYLLTAMAFYVPANLLPIMRTSNLVSPPTDHTIFSGIVDLYQSGSWGIASVVLVASLIVPALKLAVMLWLLLSIQLRWIGHEMKNTIMLRVMEFIGQWSMLDVFVVVLLAALVHYDGIMQVQVGAAAWSFGMMVIFSMLAAQHLDSRLLWNALDTEQPG